MPDVLAGLISHLVAFLNRLTLPRKRANASLQMLKRLRARPAISPIQQLDSVHDRHRPRRQLIEAADIPRCDKVGLHAVDGLKLALLKLLRKVGLEDVVGSRRAAADMPLWNPNNRKASIAQELARLRCL